VFLHGSWGREAATGRGTVIATRELLKAAGAGEIRGKTIVIQVGAAAQETQSKPKKLNREKEDACAGAENPRFSDPENGLGHLRVLVMWARGLRKFSPSMAGS